MNFFFNFLLLPNSQQSIDTNKNRTRQWQAREAEEDLRLFAAKAAKSWDKVCRKETKRVGRSKRGIKFLLRVLPTRASGSKGKATQQPPASTGQERQVDAQEKQVKKLSLKKRFLISGMKTRLDEKKQDENTPKKQRTNGGKKAAGAAGAAAAALLCIPCVAVSQRMSRKKKNGQSDEEEVRDEKKRPSLKDRLAARKTASKANREEAPGGERNKSGGLAAALLNLKIVSMAPKREDTSEKARRKKNKFSALKKRVKALRKKIVKRVRSLRPGRKSNSEHASTFDRAEDVKSAKAQGAMAGLVAGCLALPAGLHNKAKELQEKKKQKKRDDNKRKLDAMMNQPDPVPAAPGPPALDVPLTPQPPMPIPEPEELHQALKTQYLPGHGQSEIPVSAEISAVSGPGNREIQDDERARGLQNPDQTSPETAPAPASPAAAAKFKSLRDGMTNFAARASRRGTNNDTSEETTAAGTEGLAPAASRGPSSLLAPLGGSLPGLKAFRAKRGGDNGTGTGQQEAGAAVAAQESLAPHEHEEEARHADLDAGIEPATQKTSGNKFGGNLGTFMRRNNREKPVVVKDKVYKDGSGFMDRMRTIWYL